MLTNNILSSELIDIIFDGRNKDYGAYELRKTYSKRIARALAATAVIVLLAVGGAVWASSSKGHNVRDKMGAEVVLADIPDKQPEKIIEPEKPKPAEQPQVKEVAYTEPKIAPNDDVENPPPTIDETETGKISDRNVGGTEPSDIPTGEPQNIGGNTGIVDKPKNEPEPVFIPIEIDAKFDGNWKQFLERNLNAEIPISNGAPAGRYKVEVKFTIDENGNIISTDAVTNYGYGMEQEAIRVIKKANAKWEAPIQNGIKLKATMRQYITFVVTDEEG